MSGNLGITQVLASQNQKEVTINAALLRLDAAISETFDADVTAGSVTLTSDQYRAAIQVRAINATTAGRTVTLPLINRVTILRNNTTSTQSVGFVRGTTTLTLAPGETVVARTDGTANGLVALLRGTGSGGSGITLEDEGTTVAGGPHSTINFTGAGVSVANAGGGEATVTIAGGGSSSDSVTKAVRAANKSIANNTWVLMDWDGEIFDDNNGHDNSVNNSRITTPSGFTRVRLTAMINWANNSTGGRRVSIEQGTAGTQGSGTFIAADLRPSVNESTQVVDSGWIACSAGNYFECFVNQNSGAALNAVCAAAFGGRSFFQAEFRA